MDPRLHIASQIYTQLVLQDLRASCENPGRNAHKALMFADALLIADEQSAPSYTRPVRQRGATERLEDAPIPGWPKGAQRRNEPPRLH